jgi:hypothetical protein
LTAIAPGRLVTRILRITNGAATDSSGRSLPSAGLHALARQRPGGRRCDAGRRVVVLRIVALFSRVSKASSRLRSCLVKGLRNHSCLFIQDRDGGHFGCLTGFAGLDEKRSAIAWVPLAGHVTPVFKIVD